MRIILDGPDLAAQRALILSLLPPEDIVTGTSGPEPRHGALGRLAARAGLTGEAVRRAWRGVRVAPEKIAAWNS